MTALAEQILAASDRLSERLAALPPIDGLVALDPTRYCRSAWAAYLQLAARPGCVLVVGMNPGPHGMAQTGVPFTDPIIADELGYRTDDETWRLSPAPVGSWSFRGDLRRGKTRREESAKRLWGLLREVCAPYAAAGPSADKIAEATRRVCRDVLLVNALPICWLSPDGRNVSAEKAHERAREHRLAHFAEQWLAELLQLVKPSCVVGAGRWAHDRCAVAASIVAGAPLEKIRHPSPQAGDAGSWRSESEPALRRAIERARATRT